MELIEFLKRRTLDIPMGTPRVFEHVMKVPFIVYYIFFIHHKFDTSVFHVIFTVLLPFILILEFVQLYSIKLYETKKRCHNPHSWCMLSDINEVRRIWTSLIAQKCYKSIGVDSFSRYFSNIYSTAMNNEQN